jgi:hypothetical protein
VNLVGIIALLIFALYIRKKLLKIQVELDNEHITPSDYALMVFNLPLDKSEDELKEIILSKFSTLVKEQDLEIVYVNYTYNIEDFIEATSNLNDQYKKKGLVRRYQKKYCRKNKIDKEKLKTDPSVVPPPPPIRNGCCSKIQLDMSKIETEIGDLKDKIKKFEENLQVTTSIDLYIGTAFVVFSKPVHASNIIAEQDDSLVTYFFKLFFKTFCGCCINKADASHFHYERAPEPSDVYWENLNCPYMGRVKRILMTYFLTFVVVTFCFLINWGLGAVKDNMVEDLEGKEDSGALASRIRIVTVISSFFVVVVNKSLLIIVRKFSLRENHITYTSYNLSVAFKLTIARFVNSAIIPILVNY